MVKMPRYMLMSMSPAPALSIGVLAARFVPTSVGSVFCTVQAENSTRSVTTHIDVDTAFALTAFSRISSPTAKMQ